MAVGKSTLGRILANTIGYDFVDLDHQIAEQEHLPVVEIFRQKGEAYFRKVESETLKEVSTRSRILISLGGGTVCFGDNCSFIRRSGILVHIKVHPETLFLRIRAKKDRPVFLDETGQMLPDEQIRQKIKEMMEKRLPFYTQAHLTFEPQDQPVGQSVDQLRFALESWQAKNQKPASK
ncbi:MAG: shikimate kinase [Bacteroidetes bacterium]|nr:shikimate kinase [Bacteroidota bacterium]